MTEKVIFTFIEEDKDLPDKTEIEWLDQVLEIAQIITARLLLQERIIYRRLPELGNGAVLKTDDT
jgi:hypothetical protein